MFKRHSSPPGPTGDLQTLIGRGTRIHGDVFFTGGLHLDGEVVGNVRATGEAVSVLTVSELGAIEGLVEALHVQLNGTVNGDVVARERVELGPRARVSGNVHYGVIEMATGAQIHGRLVHLPAEPAQPAADVAGSAAP